MWMTQSDSPEQTRDLARALARVAPAGLVVALDGALGAGKTCFAQGMGEVLVPDADVLSPTFLLIAEHHGPGLPLLHADLYRLEDASALDAIGLEETLEAWPGVALVEWASRFPHALPPDHLQVILETIAPSPARILRVSAHGPRALTTLLHWRATCPP